MRKQNKRMPLNMRTTRDLRAKIDAAAAKSGRSLCAEVEHRVEASFYEDGLGDIRDQLEMLHSLLAVIVSRLDAQLFAPFVSRDDGGTGARHV